MAKRIPDVMMVNVTEVRKMQAKRDDAITLLKLRFPDVSDVVVKAIVLAIQRIHDPSRLDTLLAQIVSAKSLDDIDLNGVGSQWEL